MNENAPTSSAAATPGRRQWLGHVASAAVTTVAAAALTGRQAGAADAPQSPATAGQGTLPNPIVMMPAWQLSREIHAGHLSCRQVMTAYLAHIDRVNPKVNAIVALRDRDVLMREAAAADEALAAGKAGGWMHGMPQAPKDLALTRGIRTTFGSPIFKDNVPTTDAIVVERARRAGAILLGKTNTPEFGLGSQTFNTVYGATRNPYDLGKAAGGSSGGAASALAMRLLPVADGSDFGGSLRNPAGFCNVYGFRPSMGRVPYGPTAEVFI